MALPGIPANLSARIGPHFDSIYVNADAVSASPVVLDYSVYIDYITGVSKSQSRRKVTSVLPDMQILGLPVVPRYFVTVVARNSEGEGSDATAVEVTPSR